MKNKLTSGWFATLSSPRRLIAALLLLCTAFAPYSQAYWTYTEEYGDVWIEEDATSTTNEVGGIAFGASLSSVANEYQVSEEVLRAGVEEVFRRERIWKNNENTFNLGSNNNITDIFADSCGDEDRDGYDDCTGNAVQYYFYSSYSDGCTCGVYGCTGDGSGSCGDSDGDNYDDCTGEWIG